MATSKGNIESQDYNKSPVIKGKKTVWFLNKDLIKIHHYNRSDGTVAVYNVVKDRLEICFILDFKKNRERAYTISEAARIVNRHRKYMPSLIRRGVIPEPTGMSKNGKRGFRIRAYYSESQVKEIRDILASIHIGKPRKDGLVTNNMTPTKQELTRKMGDGILTYTKTEDGRFIPVWNESIR
jgi:hypothetical protein